MKLLMVTPSYFPAVRYGGTIYSVHALAKALIKLGIKVDVVTTNVDGNDVLPVSTQDWEMVEGVPVRYFSSSGVFQRLYYSKGMRSFVKSHVQEYDLIHVHAAFLWPNSFIARVARYNRRPWVWSPRGMLVKELFNRKSAWYKWPWWWFEGKKLVSEASLIHCTSDVEHRDLTELSTKGRSIIIANGVDTPQKKEIKRENKMLLYVGRISWKKRLDVLIKSFKKICDVHPDARLVIAGNDEEALTPSLVSIAQDHSILASIDFKGAVNREERDALMQQASVFSLVSEQENFGNVALEALACGCPVVITNSCGACEVVKEAKGGLIVNKRCEDVAEAILQLFDNPAQARQMGEQGAAYILEHYGWLKKAEEMKLAYQSALEETN